MAVAERTIGGATYAVYMARKTAPNDENFPDDWYIPPGDERLFSNPKIRELAPHLPPGTRAIVVTTTYTLEPPKG